MCPQMWQQHNPCCLPCLLERTSKFTCNNEQRKILGCELPVFETSIYPTHTYVVELSKKTQKNKTNPMAATNPKKSCVICVHWYYKSGRDRLRLCDPRASVATHAHESSPAPDRTTSLHSSCSNISAFRPKSHGVRCQHTFDIEERPCVLRGRGCR